VEAELRAQIEAALAAGIDVTHLDDHMGAVMVPEFLDIYIRLGEDYRIPILLTPSLSAYGPVHNLPGVPDEPYRAAAARAREAGFLIFDHVLETPWGRSGSAEAAYRTMFNGIGAGATYMAMHFNAPGELHFIEPETARIRVEEYELFRDRGFAAFIAGLDLHIVGMRTLRGELRAPPPSVS
jgi:hypothetical protein